MASITTKSDFYALYYRMALGNTIRQWDWDEYNGLYLTNDLPQDIVGYAVRVKIPNNPYMRYELSEDQAIDYSRGLIAKGVDPTDLNISELAPDHRLTLQGEIMRSTNYCDGWLRTKFDRDNPADNRMRSSYPGVCPHSHYTSGLSMWLRIKTAMDSRSWDCLQELLDTYPDDIIEFSCYDCQVGVLGCNSIIWEVRSY